MSVSTYYDTLKVTKDAPREVISAAWKAMAQKYHPDRNLNNPEAVQLMQIINAAYKILSDPVMRQEHDIWIDRQMPPAPKAAPTAIEKDAKAKIDAAQAEASKWTYWADRASGEADLAKQKAKNAAAKAATASASEKDKWLAYAKQSAADAAIAEQAAAKAAESARENQKICDATIAKLAPQHVAVAGTHYDALKITHDAPPEVIQASYRILVQKEQPGSIAHRAVETAYAVLSDNAQKAQYDAAIRKVEAPAGGVKSGERKPSAREVDTRNIAAKAAEEAQKWVAAAQRDQEVAKGEQAKADEAMRNAAAKAKDTDSAKWKTWADKLAAEAASVQRKANASAEKAAEMKAIADRAAAAAAEAKAEAEKQHAMWTSD